jgi:hypothetical protein
MFTDHRVFEIDHYFLALNLDSRQQTEFHVQTPLPPFLWKHTILKKISADRTGGCPHAQTNRTKTSSAEGKQTKQHGMPFGTQML